MDSGGQRRDRGGERRRTDQRYPVGQRRDPGEDLEDQRQVGDGKEGAGQQEERDDDEAVEGREAGVVALVGGVGEERRAEGQAGQDRQRDGEQAEGRMDG